MAQSSRVSPVFPSDSFTLNPAAGRLFVFDHVSECLTHIGLFLDHIGPDDAAIAVVVQATNTIGKPAISHAPAYADYSQAEAGMVNILRHVTLGPPIDAPSIANLSRYGAHVVPTLVMM